MFKKGKSSGITLMRSLIIPLLAAVFLQAVIFYCVLAFTGTMRELSLIHI